ncbi:MAG: 50S ribosomal protein L4 [Fervidicoccaceae archaeon]
MVLIIKPLPKQTILFSSSGEAKGNITLPSIFSIPVRKDLVKRAFLSEFTAGLQPKGRDPMAGKRTPAVSLGVGRGLARVPRIPDTSIGALANMTVGGRLAHPPRVEEKIHEEINKKEKRLATASALAATSYKELVLKRGHIYNGDSLPIIVEDDVESNINRALLAREFLRKIGVWEDIERSYERTRIRAGKGKMRGRRYVEPRSVLFILKSANSPFARAVRNFPGVDVSNAREVSVAMLAPGGVPGRLTVISNGALEELNKRFSGLVVIKSE